MENAGEVWERNYRRKKLLILGVATLLAGLAPLVIKAVGDQNVVFPGAFGRGWDLPLAVRAVIAMAYLGGLFLVGRWGWVAADEVRRSHLMSFWAATGYSVGITFFGFVLFGHDIPEADRLQMAFVVPVMLGLLFTVARWVREGYVP
ncbi:MAG TPA: hypothetical protein VF079_06245 [Sphingomicrobium sp.]